MRKFKIAFLLFSICPATILLSQTKSNVVDYVNPLMGTDSNFELSNGNTYPAIAMPWGNEFLDATDR